MSIQLQHNHCRDVAFNKIGIVDRNAQDWFNQPIQHDYDLLRLFLCGFMQVLWTTYATHYNEDYFPDHMAFDPSRFEEPIQPYVFLPFGGGPRMCAGYQLAKLNILIFIHLVVTRYNWSIQYLDEPITMDPLPFPSHGMPINIYPKKL